MESVANKFGVRHIQVALMFALLFISNALRVNMSLGIVAMTDPEETRAEVTRRVKWKKCCRNFSCRSLIGTRVHDRLFWAASSGDTQPPMSQLVPCWTDSEPNYSSLGVSSWAPSWLWLPTRRLFWATGNSPVPTVFCKGWPRALSSPGAMLCCRNGLRLPRGPSSQPLFIQVITIGSIIAPSSVSTSISLAGQLGNVVMLLIGGEIAASSLAWPGIFYISGGVGVLWCILWAIFGSNSPEECKRISKEEKHYIQSSLGQITDVDDLKVQAEYPFLSNSLIPLSL